MLNKINLKIILKNYAPYKETPALAAAKIDANVIPMLSSINSWIRKSYPKAPHVEFFSAPKHTSKIEYLGKFP